MKKSLLIILIVIGLILTGCTAINKEDNAVALSEKQKEIDILLIEMEKLKSDNSEYVEMVSKLEKVTDEQGLRLEQYSNEVLMSEEYKELKKNINADLKMHDEFYTDIINLYQESYSEVCEKTTDTISPLEAKQLYIQGLDSSLVSHKESFDYNSFEEYRDGDGRLIEELKGWYKVTEKGYRTEEECRDSLSAIFTDDIVSVYMSKIVNSDNYIPHEYEEYKIYAGQTYSGLGRISYSIFDNDDNFYFSLMNFKVDSEKSSNSHAVYTVQLPSNSEPEIGGSFSLNLFEDEVVYKLTDSGWRIASQIANFE